MSPPQSAPKSRKGDSSKPAVWYACESRVFSWMKVSWHDDWGTIDATPLGLLFDGRATSLSLRRITAVRMEGPVIPWGAYVSLAAGNVITLLMASAGAFKFLTIDNPFTYAFLAILNVIAVGSWPVNWVRTDFLSEQGQPARAYFTVASVLGRWAGGTKRLYSELRSHCDKEGV
jgi:hypothetical protein